MTLRRFSTFGFLLIGLLFSLWYVSLSPENPDYGRGWQELTDISKIYPQNYFLKEDKKITQQQIDIQKDLGELRKCISEGGDVAADCEGLVDFYTDKLTELEDRRKDIKDKFIEEFEKRLVSWIIKIQKKINLGLYLGLRSGFYIEILDLLDEQVRDILVDDPYTALDNFHNIVRYYTPPPKNKDISKVFIKQQYAQEYRTQRLNYHRNELQDRVTLKKDNLDSIQSLKNDLSAAQKKPDKNNLVLDIKAKIKHKEDEIQLYEEDIKYHKHALKKWKNETIQLKDQPVKVHPMDRILGVQSLKDRGLSGKGTKVGIIDSPSEFVKPFHTHKDFLKNLGKGSRKPVHNHAIHVTGIVAAKAKTVFDRLGVANNATIYFLPYPSIDKVKVTYYQDGHYKTFYDLDYSPSLGELVEGVKERRKLSDFLAKPRAVVHSQYNEMADKKLANTIRKLMNKGIKIINTSFSLSMGPNIVQSIKEFKNKGGIIVVAAGNDGTKLDDKALFYPGTPPIVEYQKGIDVGLMRTLSLDPELRQAFLFVGSLDTPQKLAEYSSQAGIMAKRYVAAWGSNVPSTMGRYGRGKLSGTSMAAPMVSGAISLLQEAFPACTPNQIGTIILKTARTMGDPTVTGKGRIDLEDAYTKANKFCKK